MFRINETELILFPEYHFSDFPPQKQYSKKEIEIIADILVPKNDKCCILGYVESYKNKFYSTCLIKDKNNYFHIRKKYPYKDENNIISKSNEPLIYLDLSIGRTIIFICNDLLIDLKSKEFGIILKRDNINNIGLVSAMATNFNKNLDKIKSLKDKNIVDNIFRSDRFHGNGIY